LTGLPGYPHPESLRRFLLQADPDFREQLHRVNDSLLQRFIHQPDHRSRLILDLDSTVVTVFGRQEGAAVGYNPRYRGKRSYDPWLCVEANSSLFWDVELRRGDAGRMVKIFKCAERSRSSMMDVEDEHNHMRAAFGLRDRIDQPGTPAAE